MKVLYKIQVNSSIVLQAELEGTEKELKEFLANLIISLASTEVTVEPVNQVKVKKGGKQKTAALATQCPKHSSIDINKNSQQEAMEGNIEGFVPRCREEAKTAGQILDAAKETTAFQNMSWTEAQVREYLKEKSNTTVWQIQLRNGSYKFYLR